MWRYLPLIFKSSLRNRRRTLLTVCSVALSLCLLGVLMAIYHAFFFSEATPEQALRLVTRNRISLATVMPISYKQQIAKVPGVRAVIAQQWFGGVYKDPKDFFARFAVEPEGTFAMFPEYVTTPDEQKAFVRERTACAIGRTLARKYSLKLGDRMTIKGDIFPVTLELTVRAIFDYPPDEEVLLFHMDYLYELLSSRRRDFAGTYAIKADSPESVPRIAKAVDELFRNAPVQTRTESEKAFQLSFVSFLGNIKLFLMAICGAVTFTILLVSANTMAMSVRERVREVGVLKTLGFSNGSILGMILGEAALISLIGGLLGLGLAALMTGVVRQGPAIFIELKTLTIQPPVAVAILFAGVLIGVASSFLPAWNASRTPILDSLRYTG